MSCNLDYKRVLHKGKSFECGKWQPFITYTNDCLKQDFVTCNGALFVCLETHLSSEDNMPKLVYGDPQNPHEPTGTNSQYWGYVLSGFSDWEKLSSDIQKQILESIDGLDTKDTEILGHYVSSVIQDDGKLTIKRRELPTSKISCDNDWLSIHLNQKSGAISDISVQIKDIAKHTDLQTLSDKINKLEPEQHVIKTSWFKLKVLRDGNKLIPGTIYRITDYITTTTQPQTRSAGHQFDILVIALDEKTLSENAAAIIHEGDEYFSINGSNLLAWELKYSLDNDSNRFYWADENGKGVIYYMKDEWNNECPYDFKNIQFLQTIYISAKDISYNIVMPNTRPQSEYCYTFSWLYNGEDMFDASIYWNNGMLSQFGSIVTVASNVIKSMNTGFLVDLPGINMDDIDFTLNQQILNYITFFSGVLLRAVGGFFENTFDKGCSNMSFGDFCWYNNFGVGCTNFIFGSRIRGNVFGQACHSNAFESNCDSNTFGNNCTNNIFGEFCVNNTFGNAFQSNRFGSDCESNTFGNNCHDNTFGAAFIYNKCSHRFQNNILGSDYYYNTFNKEFVGNSFRNTSLNVSNMIKNNQFDSPVHDTMFISLDAEKYLQNYKFISDLSREIIKPRTIELERGLQYETKVAWNSKGILKQWCDADLIE